MLALNHDFGAWTVVKVPPRKVRAFGMTVLGWEQRDARWLEMTTILGTDKDEL